MRVLVPPLLETAVLELQAATFGGELLLGRLESSLALDELVRCAGNLPVRGLELLLSSPQARGSSLYFLFAPIERGFGLFNLDLLRAEGHFPLVDLAFAWDERIQALLNLRLAACEKLFRVGAVSCVYGGSTRTA